MLSRGLIIPYCWGKTQPNAPWIIGSPIWLVVAGTTSALCETGALFPLTLLDSSFPNVRYFPHMYALTCTLIDYSTGTCRVSLGFFVHFSHLQYSVLPTILSLDSQLNSGSPLDSSWVTSFLDHYLEAFSMQKAVAIIGLTSFFPYLSGNTVLCCLMSTAIITIVPYILSFLEEREF